jgi:protein TonB
VGESVSVVLAEHDFFGVLLPEKTLAFVPARCVRLLPPPPGTPTPGPATKGGVFPQVEPLFPEAGSSTAPRLPSAVGPPAPISSPADESAGGGRGPLSSLPAGATAPVLVRRVDPVYPEMARRLRLNGDVTLRLVVEADGKTGRIEVVSGGKAGFGEAAADAVRKWVYKAAVVDGRPVAVWKIVRVRFAIEPERDVPND